MPSGVGLGWGCRLAASQVTWIETPTGATTPTAASRTPTHNRSRALIGGLDGGGGGGGVPNSVFNNKFRAYSLSEISP